MATFNGSPNISPYATMPLHTPDFSFLAKAYSTKQQQSDRGFSQVKSFYNSALNMPLTSEANKKYREDAFKKLEQTIKSVAHVDLSKTQNINMAIEALDPIAKDKELLMDYMLTSKNNSEQNKLQAALESTDPDVRETYNEASAYSIMFSKQDLQKARRGTGEIMKIQPGKFVPFENVNAYLSKMQKEQGIDIETIQSQNGYIHTVKNGPQAGLLFSQWAQVQMGTRFDNQFQFMGQMEAEKAIRQTMEAKGISRQDAIKEVANLAMPGIIETVQNDMKQKSEAYGQIENNIALVEKYYTDPNTMPEDIKEYYSGLKAAQSMSKEDIKKQQLQLQDISDKKLEFVAKNLGSLLGEYGKQGAAATWGQAYAMATYKEDKKSDPTWVALYNEQGRNQRFMVEMQYKYDALAMQAQKAKSGSSADGSSKDESSETFLGYTANKTAGFAGKYLNEVEAGSWNGIMTNTFGVNGLLELAVPSSQTSLPEYRNAINNFSNFGNVESANKGQVLPQDVKAMQELMGQLGINVSNYTFDSKMDAKQIVLDVAEAVNKKAMANASVLKDLRKTPEGRKYADAQLRYMANAKLHKETREDIVNNQKVIANYVQQYKDVLGNPVQTGIIEGGIPTYNLDNIPEEHKAMINNIIDESVKSKLTQPAMSFQFNGLKQDEIFAIQQLDDVYVVDASGEKIKLDGLKNLNLSDFDELFASNMTTTFDKSSQTVRIKLNPSLPSKTSKILGIEKPMNLELEIPYSQIQAQGQSLQRFNKHISYYNMNTPMIGAYEKLLQPFGTVTSSPMSGQMGFNYTLQNTFNANGQSGLAIDLTVYDPTTKRNVKMQEWFEPMDVNEVNIHAALQKLKMNENNYYIQLESLYKSSN